MPKRERVVAQFFVYVSQNVMRNILQLTSWGRSGNKHSIKEGQQNIKFQEKNCGKF